MAECAVTDQHADRSVSRRASQQRADAINDISMAIESILEIEPDILEVSESLEVEDLEHSNANEQTEQSEQSHVTYRNLSTAIISKLLSYRKDLVLQKRYMERVITDVVSDSELALQALHGDGDGDHRSYVQVVSFRVMAPCVARWMGLYLRAKRNHHNLDRGLIAHHPYSVNDLEYIRHKLSL